MDLGRWASAYPHRSTNIPTKTLPGRGAVSEDRPTLPTDVRCVTGRGTPGDEFLKALSNKVPGRRIIAFTTIVWYSLFRSTAGQVKDPGVHQRILTPRKESSYTGKPNLEPNSAKAKWAKDGKISPLARDDERLGKPKPPPKADPIWLNKELWELRRNPGPFMSLKRKLEKQGKYYYVSREDLEGCKNYVRDDWECDNRARVLGGCDGFELVKRTGSLDHGGVRIRATIPKRTILVEMLDERTIRCVLHLAFDPKLRQGASLVQR